MSLVVGVFALPIVAVAAVFIIVDDGLPVFFFQRRVGRFEKLFIIVKLRTMATSACGDALSPSNATDRRVTRVGRVLRKLSIDELPQLWNVLKGEMSMVGPRPEMPFVVNRYDDWQHLRHLTRPGLTCIWQSSYRKTLPLQSAAATQLDLEYIQRASPSLDAKLLAQTAFTIIFPKGAY